MTAMTVNTTPKTMGNNKWSQARNDLFAALLQALLEQHADEADDVHDADADAGADDDVDDDEEEVEEDGMPTTRNELLLRK